ncbi:hypothetical protein HMPREF1317_1448 [Schaalia georgiae F0490]|uniref:Uncharacterized protein n=1 Tax=Schaalia georgiae F0490 TaxID=1125717 RepID=J0MWC8_9ACTO|nr:hypothetical protein HMPREF1317_1448 [Schaalia georgiae F0490]
MVAAPDNKDRALTPAPPARAPNAPDDAARPTLTASFGIR